MHRCRCKAQFANACRQPEEDAPLLLAPVAGDQRLPRSCGASPLLQPKQSPKLADTVFYSEAMAVARAPQPRREERPLRAREGGFVETPQLTQLSAMLKAVDAGDRIIKAWLPTRCFRGRFSPRLLVTWALQGRLELFACSRKKLTVAGKPREVVKS